MLLITTWLDYKTTRDAVKKLNITSVLDKMQNYRRNWVQHLNRMPCNRLLKIIKNYKPEGRRNQG